MLKIAYFRVNCRFMMLTPKQICARNGISLSTFKRKIQPIKAILYKNGKRKRFYNSVEVELIQKIIEQK